MSLQKSLICSQQIKEFFRNFFNDINQILLNIKFNLYQLIQIDPSNLLTQNHKEGNSSISSILNQCKATIDDLIRIDSLLEGYKISKSYGINFEQNEYEDDINYQENQENENYNSVTFNNINQNPKFFVKNAPIIYSQSNQDNKLPKIDQKSQIKKNIYFKRSKTQQNIPVNSFYLLNNQQNIQETNFIKFPRETKNLKEQKKPENPYQSKNSECLSLIRQLKKEIHKKY